MTNKMVSNEDQALILGMRDTGLLHDEALIYLHLLKIGKETGVSKIAFATGIHRQYVHVVLQKLTDLSLVLRIREGARHKYKATPPSSLERIARKKFDAATDVVERLNHVSSLGYEQDFEVFVGDRQVKQYEFDFVANLKEEEIQYVISGASENFLSYFGDEYAILASGYREARLKTLYIGGSDEKESLERIKKMNPGFEYRVLSGMPNGVTSTVVRHDSFILYSLANPPLIYVIKSKKIAEEYKKYFDVLWRIAR